MNRKALALILILGFLVFQIPLIALGNTDIKNSWLGTYPDICPDLSSAANSCTLCHGDAFALNDYANDYLANGESWQAIEGIDSDSDTVNNFQEILDCTLPGDPASVTPNDTYSWGRIKSLFN